MENQIIYVVDFGGQYKELIARRIRDLNVYCEIHSYKKVMEKIKERKPDGIVFTGGPSSVYQENAPTIDKEIFNLGIPVLGICYGMQIMAHTLGGKVNSSDKKEFGKTITYTDDKSQLFKNIEKETITWMSHVDYVEKMPEGFQAVAHTDHTPIAAMENKEKNLYAVQFHLEVSHTPKGTDILKNFLLDACKCKQDWNMEDYAKKSIKEIKEKVGDKKVLLALSGGVDSSVVAALISKAIGKNLTCIFVDHGLLRKNEANQVQEAFKDSGMNFIKVDAQDRFLGKLAGVTEPEKKRKIIGEEFIRVFEEEAKKVGKVDYLAQGTIYADVVESGEGEAATIKSHHNVGGLPEHVDFKELIEPLRTLFKDEVRKLGMQLGLPKPIVMRQPFPGPGLAIRVIGEITREKLEILKEADYIYREELEKSNQEYNELIEQGKEIDPNKAYMKQLPNQYFAVLTNNRSVGVMGDFRTYDYTLALRAVNTTDFMTADWTQIPYEILDKVSRRIINEVGHINRIVYDITSKPPATIEWE